MKNLDNFSLGKIRDLVDKNDSIGIIVGKAPRVDDMAGALSLYLSLLASEKNTSVVCPTEPLVEVSSLVGIDKIKTAFDLSKSGDITVSFPYREGEIEKISYTLENGFLNILVKAGGQGLSFDEKDVKYTRAEGSKKVIFTIGILGLSELNRFVGIESLKDVKIINIDNKAENQGYGDVVLVSANSSSISELVAFILFSLDFKVDTDIAQNLLAGISQATDNFQYPKTTALAFEMAANLMKKGAVRIDTSTRKTTTENQDFSSFFSPGVSKRGKDTDKVDQDDTPPSDWLAPKIYKGSTTI